MPDRQVTVERGQGPVVEHVGHEAHVLHHREVVAVGCGDARGFLAPVLQGVDAEVGQVGRRLPGCVDPEHAAGLTRLAVVGSVRCRGGGRLVRET